MGRPSAERMTRVTETKLPGWDAKRKYKGSWWPAHDATARFEGTLRFRKRQPQLTLIAPPVGQEVFALGRTEVVHGQLDSGEMVTLWDLQSHWLEHRRPTRSNELSRYRRTFSYALRGAYLEGFDDARFSRSAYRLHGMKSWSQIVEPIPRGLTGSDLPQYPVATRVGLHADDFGVEYTVGVRIENPLRVETDERWPEGAIFDHTGDDVRVVFDCVPPAPAKFHDLLLFDLQSLLTFSYQDGAPVEEEWLESVDSKTWLSVVRHDAFKGAKPRPLGQSQMVLTPQSVSTEHLFNAWWRVIDDLFPACQVITAYHHGTRGVLEGSVTSAIAVIERLHSIVGETKHRFPPGYLETKSEELKHTYPGKELAPFRQFLREALRNNRPTFDVRLQEVLDVVTENRLSLLGIDGADWTSGVKAMRNLLAHTASHVDRRDRDASNRLDRVNAQTRAIIVMLILHELAVPANELDEAARVLAIEVRRFAPDD